MLLAVTNKKTFLAKVRKILFSPGVDQRSGVNCGIFLQMNKVTVCMLYDIFLNWILMINLQGFLYDMINVASANEKAAIWCQLLVFNCCWQFVFN